MRVLGLLLCLLAIASLAGGQSLGELARKERERREKLRKAGVSSRTVTEKELAETTGELATDPDAAPAVTPETRPTRPLPPRPTRKRGDRDPRYSPEVLRAEPKLSARIRPINEKLEELYEKMFELQQVWLDTSVRRARRERALKESDAVVGEIKALQQQIRDICAEKPEYVHCAACRRASGS
jgi:hypothetical protein